MVLLIHSTGRRFLSVPSSAVPVTSIAMRSPVMIRPTMVTTLMVVNQYSISPYLRTLRTLNRIGAMKKIDIHKARDLSLQYDI